MVTRVACNAMETRGCIAHYDSFEDRYELRATVQSVHGIRNQIAGMLGRLSEQERDAESLMTDEQARGGLVDAELALDENHKFLALRTHTKVPIGAYFATDRNIRSVTGGQGGLAGVYGVPAIHGKVTGAFSNLIGNAQYRGGAKPEPVYVIECMVDVAARELGIDPVELRRINTIGPDAMPFATSLGDVYDCGDFVKNFDDCLKVGDYAGADARREDAKKRGKILGVGSSNSVTGVASTNFEHVEVRFDASGGITLLSGAMDHGQGHGTTFKQVLADRLGIDGDGITYRFGDTDKVATGVGTFNARCAVFVGSAVVNAAEKIVEKGKRIAAHLLEAADADIEFANGTFTVAGTDRSIDIKAVAKAAFNKAQLPPDIEPGLYEHGEFGMGQGQAPTYPNGCHLAEVEIDVDTGKVDLVRYSAVDDAGTILNPLLFDGQVHGGIVQGAGQIMMEEVYYDESGQLITGSFMDYGMPRADDFCSFDISANVVPTARSPLGVKGVGEAGTVGAMPAMMNAINDALHHAGAPAIEMPATPLKVWKALQQAKG